MRFGSIIIIGATAFTIAACGSDDEVVYRSSNGTEGQRLMDLQDAYAQGAISKKEYKKARENIVDPDDD